MANIRTRLDLVMSVAIVASMALKEQSADADAEVAVLLQRCIADELFNQLERLDHILANVRMISGNFRFPEGES